MSCSDWRGRGWFAGLALVISVAALHAAAASAQTVAASAQTTAGRMSDARIAADLGATTRRLAGGGRFSGAVLLARNGTVLFQGAYGLANRASHEANTVNTAFALASVTKLFTQVAIMQLAEAGRLSLDAPLSTVWPGYPNKAVAAKVTVRELLDHRSGLGDFARAMRGRDPADYATPASILPLFVNQPLRFEPGTARAYSNAGYIVLALVIAHVSGQSYFQYVKNNIFARAGMTHSGFVGPSIKDSNLAVGYTTRGFGRGAAPRPAPRSARGISGAGAAYSTVGDMWRFSEALLGHKLLNGKYTRLLLGGGYGMLVGTINGIRHADHGGGEAGANTYIEIYPDLGYTAVILANEDPPAAAPIYRRLQKELSGVAVPAAGAQAGSAPKSMGRSSRGSGEASAANGTGLSGKWQLELRINGRIRATPACTVHQTGNSLSGSCRGPHSQGPVTGSVDGDRVTLRWLTNPTTRNGAKGMWVFRATVASDGTLRGTGVAPGGRGGSFTGHKIDSSRGAAPAAKLGSRVSLSRGNPCFT